MSDLELTAWGPAGRDPEGPPQRLSGQTRRPEFLDDPGYADALAFARTWALLQGRRRVTVSPKGEVTIK